MNVFGGILESAYASTVYVSVCVQKNSLSKRWRGIKSHLVIALFTTTTTTTIIIIIIINRVLCGVLVKRTRGKL